MSNLRILGLIAGILAFSAGFWIFRGKRWDRFNFFFSIVLGFTLSIISISPEVVNILQRILKLEEAERGRLIALLVCSNLVLWFSVVYFKATLFDQKIQFDKVVRAISAGKGERLYKLEDIDIGINFYIGITLMGVVLFLFFSTLKNPDITMAIGYSVFSFFSGNGAYHGFFWVVPSFYCVLLWLLTCRVFFTVNLGNFILPFSF